MFGLVVRRVGGNPEIKYTQTEPQHSGGLSGSGAVLVQPRQCHRCQSDADQYGIMAVRGQCARVLCFVFVDKIGKLHHINRKHRKQNHNHGQCADFKLRRVEIQYFQVAMQLPENRNREVGNLVNLPDNYQKTVLTANRMDVGEVDGVKVVHVVDWLVGES